VEIVTEVSRNSPYNAGVPENPTLDLLRTIGSPFIPPETSYGEESWGTYQHAVKNKIPLLYLEAIKQQGKLKKLKANYDEECARHRRFIDAIAKVSGLFEAANIEYAIFKTIKPYRGVPNDVDLIIIGDDAAYRKAVEVLLRACYVPFVPHYLVDMSTLGTNDSYMRAAEVLSKPTCGKDHVSPTGTGFVDPEYNIDVDPQKELAISYLVYMDKNRFKGNMIQVELPNGSSTNALRPELDLACVLAHSLIEHTCLLGDYYTVLYRLSKMDEAQMRAFAHVVRENNITMAAKSCFSVVTELHRAAHGEVPGKLAAISDELGIVASEIKNVIKNGFTTPHKYNKSTVARLYMEKLHENRFRRSLALQMFHTLDPRLLKMTIADLIERRKE